MGAIIAAYTRNAYPMHVLITALGDKKSVNTVPREYN